MQPNSLMQVTQVRGKPERTGHNLSPTGPLLRRRALLSQGLELWEGALGPQNENVAICLNNLATLLQDRGQFAEAEPMLKRALAIQEKLFGAGHLEQPKSWTFWEICILLEVFKTSRNRLSAIARFPREGFEPR